MEVSEVLKKAWSAVADADLPESIQTVAFREAVRLLSPQPYLAAPPFQPPRSSGGRGGGSGTPSAGDGNGEPGSSAVAEAELYDKVAQHTGVDRDRLERLIHLDGDVVRVSLPGIKLGRNNADKTRAVAQILTIARGFGLEEDGTLLEVVRSEVQRLKCYDSANFASHLGKLTGFVITGAGNNRRLRAKAPGIAAFSTLVDDLVGAAE